MGREEEGSRTEDKRRGREGLEREGRKKSTSGEEGNEESQDYVGHFMAMHEEVYYNEEILMYSIFQIPETIIGNFCLANFILLGVFRSQTDTKKEKPFLLSLCLPHCALALVYCC